MYTLAGTCDTINLEVVSRVKKQLLVCAFNDAIIDKQGAIAPGSLDQIKQFIDAGNAFAINHAAP